VDKFLLKSINEITANPKNARTHPADQIALIVKSIKKFGFLNPVIIDADGVLIAGHGRIEAARQLEMEMVPAILADHLTPEEKRAYMLADNQIALKSGWDMDMLKIELQGLSDMNFDMDLTGFAAADIDSFLKPEEKMQVTGKAGSLVEKFLVAPFSVLNARDGWWQSRKRAWISKGIQSELGRGENLLKFSEQANKGYKKKNLAKATNTTDWVKSKGLTGLAGDGPTGTGTSIFDPVLCELNYSWFCPPGGSILDPFAGGSVRGMVAAFLGRKYTGVDLRAEQVEANSSQAKEINFEIAPEWIVGDSRDIIDHVQSREFDFVFSCPPYADLEVYSDDPQDLSTLSYPEFKNAYFEIIKKSCSLLRDNRFAAFVVGEVRDKQGNYYDFVGDTVQAFRDAGLEFYNEAILITSAGSLPIRAGKQFSSSRKLGKTHQNVLIFVKGDGKKAAEACGDVEIYIADDAEKPASEYGEEMA